MDGDKYTTYLAGGGNSQEVTQDWSLENIDKFKSLEL